MPRTLRSLFVIMLLVSAFAACGEDDPDGRTQENAIPLPNNTWVNGNIDVGEVQWFSFTMNTGTWRFEFEWGTLDSVEARIYDGDESPISQAGSNYHDTTTIVGISGLELEVGITYYVKVSPHETEGSGTFRIRYFEVTSP